MAHFGLRSALIVFAATTLACGAGSDGKSEGLNGDGSTDDTSGLQPGDTDPDFSVGDGPTPPCTGLKCQQVKCTGADTTSVSGTIYDPAGRVPLYNIIVYVPNAPLDPIPKPLTCDKCGAVASGSPIVTALSDSKGKFVLKDVPVGKDIPLVMQVGKWRRQITIPEVKACVDNPISDKNQTRLPKNRKEGNIPQIAVTTGNADELECFLREIGIDDSEFVPGGGSGAVHMFQGWGGSVHGAGLPQAQVFWSKFDNLRYYDIVILSCEGAEHAEEKPSTALSALEEYLNKGGRVFASHYHYYWFKYGPTSLQSTATWTGGGTATPYLIDTTFPKGKAFGEWLVNVGASTVLGQINLDAVKNDVGTVTKGISQRWVYKDGPESVKYLSFATPVGKPIEAQCGRAVFSDIHISNANGGGSFPSMCSSSGSTFSPQEKALEFLFFDLSSCLQPDGEMPKPPPVK